MPDRLQEKTRFTPDRLDAAPARERAQRIERQHVGRAFPDRQHLGVAQEQRDARVFDVAGAAGSPTAVEAGARRFALTIGRSFALALLARHAQWALTHEQDERPLAAARRFMSAGIELLHEMNADDARRLALDEH